MQHHSDLSTLKIENEANREQSFWKSSEFCFHAETF